MPPTASNVIVVGRNGYIGAHVVETLRREGVHVIALSSAECNFLDAGAVSRFFRSLGAGPYAVVFCAVLNKWKALSFSAFVDNVTLVRHFVEHHHLAQIQRIIHFSTVEVYGRRPPVPLTELSLVDPDSWYSLAKYVGEWMLMSSGEVRCPVTILRIPGVYGHWPNDHSVIGKMVASARQAGHLVVTGTGRVLRDYVFLPDLSELVVRLLRADHHGVLNVATGRSRPIVEIARLVCEMLGVPFRVVYREPEAEREFDLVFDVSALRSAIGDLAFTELEVGLRSYLTTPAAVARP